MRQFMTIVSYLCETAEIQGTHDGDAYFEFNADDTSPNHLSRTTLVYMSPQDFLAVAESGYDEGKTANVASILRRGAKFKSLPFLQFEHDGKGLAQVVGHEGRHRARALQSLGVKQIPVVLSSRASAEGKAIRWGNRDNKKSFDYIDVMPTQLRGEDGRATIAMPESVIFP